MAAITNGKRNCQELIVRSGICGSRDVPTHLLSSIFISQIKTPLFMIFFIISKGEVLDSIVLLSNGK